MNSKRNMMRTIKTKKILSDIDIWSYLIEKVVVNQDGSITFIFNNGKGIKIAG